MYPQILFCNLNNNRRGFMYLYDNCRTRKNNMKKMVSLVLALILAVSVLTGCSGGSNSQATDSSKADASKTEQSAAEASKAEASQAEEPEATEFTYPMDGTVTLTLNMDDYDLSEIPEYAQEHYFWTELEERTGVKLDFIGSTSYAAEPSQEFLLMLSSGEWPDIIVCNWVGFPGGPTAAISDGYIRILEDYKDYMPNLFKYLEENPDIDRMIRTDDGQVYSMPWLREKGTQVGEGLVIREDWLEKVGLGLPETMDDMYQALTKFKNELGVKTPITFELRWLWLQTASASISNPYNTLYPYYIWDNEVKYGPLEEGYKEFVTELAKWYKEGLLDTDIASIDKSTVQSKFSNEEASVSIQQYSNVDNCIKALAESNPEAKVAALPSLVKNAGETPHLTHYWAVFDGGYEMALSSTTEQIEPACRFMDFMYSQDGINLCAYGTEGVTYEADADGNFTNFTDLVLNNPNGDNPSTVRNYFAHPANYTYPSRDLNYFVADNIKDMMQTWTADMENYWFPPVTLSVEENKTFSAKYSTLDTYCRENITKFILGTNPIEQWDQFVAEIEKLGASELLAIQQAAYERFIAR